MKNQIGYLLSLAVHVGHTMSYASFSPRAENQAYTHALNAHMTRSMPSLNVMQTNPAAAPDPQSVAAQYRFDREHIPPRAVHAAGVGAHGTFTVTTDFARQYTVMDVLDGSDKGSFDTARNVRGFALKFRTNQGIWDLVMNNTPVFFIRRPEKFPILIHSQSRSLVNNLPDADKAFGYLADNPESLNQFLRTLSDAGLAKGWLQTDAFTGHAYKWIKSDGSWVYVKLWCRSNQGTANFTLAEDFNIGDPDLGARALYTSIDSGQFPSWTVFAQVLTPSQALNFRYDVLDVTKEWPFSLVEPREIGRFQLNQNPSNYFTDVEQLAFSPGNVVRGWAPSEDPVLQMRLLAYPDAQRYRLGPNYQQIPINCPMRCPAQSFEYNFDCPQSSLADGQIPPTRTSPTKPDQLPDIDYEQPRYFYGNLTSDQKSELIHTFVGGLSQVQDHDIRSRLLDVINHASPELAYKISSAL
ncbi:catalase-like domain-containing protein [Melampsora americana]|nr:catalase-like domain-containing protein [Melampsora americana]